MVYGFRDAGGGELVLKLTPQSQYGIPFKLEEKSDISFEVDSTESIWYKSVFRGTRRISVLKLTPQSQYGIRTWSTTTPRQGF